VYPQCIHSVSTGQTVLAWISLFIRDVSALFPRCGLRRRRRTAYKLPSCWRRRFDYLHQHTYILLQNVGFNHLIHAFRNDSQLKLELEDCAYFIAGLEFLVQEKKLNPQLNEVQILNCLADAFSIDSTVIYNTDVHHHDTFITSVASNVISITASLGIGKLVLECFKLGKSYLPIRQSEQWILSKCWNIRETVGVSVGISERLLIWQADDFLRAMILQCINKISSLFSSLTDDSSYVYPQCIHNAFTCVSRVCPHCSHSVSRLGSCPCLDTSCIQSVSIGQTVLAWTSLFIRDVSAISTLSSPFQWVE